MTADPVEAERDRILEIVKRHYRYWSEADSDNAQAELMSMAASGAIANIMVEIVTGKSTINPDSPTEATTTQCRHTNRRWYEKEQNIKCLDCGEAFLYPKIEGFGKGF